MPTATIYFSDEEDKKIDKLSKKLKIAKYEAVKRMIHAYKESP